MRVRIDPGGVLEGAARVPGDKSIAHRWLILASTATGRSRLVDLPASLDVRSTASCLAAVTSLPRPALEAWAPNGGVSAEGHRSTWNPDRPNHGGTTLELQGEGRSALVEAPAPLPCGNSGTSMRLLSGLLAAAPFRSELSGDPSLSGRPMERVAGPLRAMGATVRTRDGHAPIVIQGGALRGIHHRPSVPSAQVKGAVLLAGLAAQGPTVVEEPAPTRDHTERALAALGAPIAIEGRRVSIERFQHGGFEGRCPGDPSSAAFLVAAAALTGSALRIEGVGLNPSRLRFLDVMARQGIRTDIQVEREELGEPVGRIDVRPGAALAPVWVPADELPLVIDEVPVLAVVAAHAPGESRFLDAGELRVKETDRLTGLADGLSALGGHAAVEGDDLVLAGGRIGAGVVGAAADHRMAMAFAVGALAATAPIEVTGMESAEVSFPDFVPLLRSLGAHLEVVEP